MGIFVHEKTGEFHLYNNEISYIMKVLRNGQLGQLYFGKRIAQKDNYDYMIENSYRPTSAYVFEGEYSFSLEHLKQENQSLLLFRRPIRKRMKRRIPWKSFCATSY